MTIAQTNLLLAMLPMEQRFRLLSVLEAVVLPVKTALFQPEQTPKYVHFITSGMASIVAHMADGNASEIGIVGHEGMPESLHLLGPALLQTSCFMHIAGSGLRMKYKEFERLFYSHEDIRNVLLRYVQFQNVVLGQTAACNRLHRVEERLARWLLTVADRMEGPELPLSHECIAQMLGTRRSTVTIVAGTLQGRGLIEYTRGRVRIVDRKGLEQVSCECCWISHLALKRLRYSGLNATSFGSKEDTSQGRQPIGDTHGLRMMSG